MTVTRYDQIEVKATVTTEGFIRDRPVITRAGVFEYHDKSGKTIKEWRPAEEVFAEDSLATILGIPITDTHKGLVTSDNVSSIIGTVLSPGERLDESVVADIVIHNSKRLGKRRELSLGYKAEIVATPGVTPDGQRYDAKQTNIRYNHLAVVELGRAGIARLRLDSTDASSFEVEDEMTTDPKMAVVRLDNGLEYAAAQEVARAFAGLVAEIEDRKKNYDTLQAQKDSLAGQVAEATMILEQVSSVIQDEAKQPKELPAKVKALIEGMEAQIKERIALETVAKRHDVKFDEKTTARKLKEDIVIKLRGDSFRFDGKSDDYVSSAYDLATLNDDDKSKKIVEQRRATFKQDTTGRTVATTGAAAARTKMINNIRVGRTI